MMRHTNAHQDTVPQCSDPATLDAESQFEAGYNQAASIDEPHRTQVYRQFYRTSQHPFARGFRKYVIAG